MAHFATEWPWLPVAAEVLRRDLSGRVEVAVSRLRTDPWTWHEGSNGGRPGDRPAELRGRAPGKGAPWPPLRHHRPSTIAPRRSDRSPWNWLLLVPIVVPLLVPLYNQIDPTLFGWPRFYWLQLAFVALGVATTVLVYRMTRRSSTDRRAARDAIARDRER